MRNIKTSNITMKNYDGTQILNLDQDGNKYMVGFYDKLTKKYTHKKFATLDPRPSPQERNSPCITEIAPRTTQPKSSGRSWTTPKAMRPWN